MAKLSLVPHQGAGGFTPTRSNRRQARRVSEAAAGPAQSRWHAMRGQTVRPGRNPRPPLLGGVHRQNAEAFKIHRLGELSSGSAPACEQDAVDGCGRHSQKRNGLTL